MGDIYNSYAELSAAETYGVDYDFQSDTVSNSTHIAIAIHGGGIERGSGEVAIEVASGIMDFYEFRGLKPSGNDDLHITSTLFDEPTALGLVASARRCLSFHGYVGTDSVAETAIGGLDTVLMSRVQTALEESGFTVVTAPYEINGDDPDNICNQTSTSSGVQLEMSRALRDSFFYGGASAESSASGLRTPTFYQYVSAIRSAYIGYGVASVGAVNSSRWTILPVDLQDVSVSATVSTDILSAGGSQYFHVTGRFQDVNNFYSARLDFTTAQAVVLTIRKRVSGTETFLVQHTTGFTHAAGSRFGVELELNGTTLQARAWEEGTTPGAWMLTTTDSDISDPGQIACRHILSSANSNTLPVVYRVGDVRVRSLTTVPPTNSLSEVTSDDSDDTFIGFDLADNSDNWSLRVASHTPPANHQRHRIRGRIRIKVDAGTATEDIDLGRGTEDYIEYDTVAVDTTFTDLVGSWYQTAEYGLATAGALANLNIGGGWPDSGAGGMTELHTSECYVDIDCRARPDYSPEIRDNAGVDQTGGTVTDTNHPVLYFGTVSYDDIPSLDWSVTVQNDSSTVVFTSSDSGAPPVSVSTTGLPNGAYTAEFTVRSTIRGSDPFPHTQTLAFSVENTVPPPSPPLVTVDQEFDGYLVSWSNPGGQAWDNDYVVAEVWRDDCTGSYRIATVPDGLNGSYLDLAIPQLDPQIVPGPDCESSSEPCDITYRVRYHGYVSTLVELPSTIPNDMIFAWPGTSASIPSGWTRVTTLDDVYPRGASTTDAPSGTGGSTSHSHTTPSHTHSIGSHNHLLGGNTGTSNSSTTSARYSGAGIAQANQPHSHVRPSGTSVNLAANSGSSSPGTSSGNNIPPTVTVIWISSDGSQAAYPAGILGWSTEVISGWEDDADSSGRYLKGAAPAGDGGDISGSATHTHSVSAHTHSGWNHNHPIANTSLSVPIGTDAGYGSSTPRWLPRHSHPMTTTLSSTGSLSSASGGTTGSSTREPSNRRLRVIRNTGGGIQTRVIGLYLGTVAGLNPLLTLCDGSNGTPDMRTYFARDRGTDSVNSTGGSSTHTHSVPTHTHGIGSHTHDTNIGVSGTGSYEAPSFGDLGSSPTTSHTHSSGNTAATTPTRSSSGSGTTNSVSHVPPYAEAHFVRLDGTISGGPLPVPELRTSDFASATVPSFTYGDDLDRLSSLVSRISVITDRSHAYPRLVAESTPIDGGLHSVSTTLAGEDLTLTIATEGLPAINMLEDMLSNSRVYWSPVGGTPGWFAPGGWTVRAPSPGVKVVQVTAVRQDWPETSDPEEFL